MHAGARFYARCRASAASRQRGDPDRRQITGCRGRQKAVDLRFTDELGKPSWREYKAYSHAIPAMQEEAAALIAGLVFAGE